MYIGCWLEHRLLLMTLLSSVAMGGLTTQRLGSNLYPISPVIARLQGWLQFNRRIRKQREKQITSWYRRRKTDISWINARVIGKRSAKSMSRVDEITEVIELTRRDVVVWVTMQPLQVEVKSAEVSASPYQELVSLNKWHKRLRK